MLQHWEERAQANAVPRRSFRGFISLLVINGRVSFLMEGNREEMVSRVHLSGVCLNRAGNRSGLCTFEKKKPVGLGLDVRYLDSFPARGRPRPSPPSTAVLLLVAGVNRFPNRPLVVVPWFCKGLCY